MARNAIAQVAIETREEHMRRIEERENIAVDLAIESIEDEIMSDVTDESAQEHALAQAQHVQAQQAWMHQVQQAQ